MNYIEAMKKIKAKQTSHIYLIFGEENFLIESVINQIIKSLTKGEETEDRLSRFDLRDTPISDVLHEAETYPFFDDHKIIIADHASFLTAKQIKTQVEHNVDDLLTYIEAPVDFSTVILVAPYDKLDSRKKITKQLKKQAMVIECQEVNTWEVDKWIAQMAKQYQISIDKAAEQLLINEVGANLGLLEKEIEKLALYVGENGKVTVEIARELVAHHGNATGLTLVDMVIAKNLQGAIQIYRNLIKFNEEPIALIALLASQLRTIYQVKILLNKGYRQHQMAKQLKVHSYVVKMSLEREKKFSLDKLYRCLTACAEADQAIKRGEMDKDLAFEFLLYQLIDK